MRMTEKYVLIEYECTINAIIHKTFRGTHRIKLTAFNVSNKYITLGASSGGIYIFNREPCSFIKLIPSQHGPVGLIAISDNEENVAIGTASGLVIIVESCFDNSIFQQQVYSEHENQTLTALKWNGCDLYCGDTAGKVSVITTKDFLTKAIFQTPTACLMHLDAPIVQLDAHSKFLLVSTTTRSLICDTEVERYKQIGKKLRDGPFGSCFFGADEKALPNGTSETSRGKFQTVQDHEQFTSSSCDADLKIYCARPGARLWLADIQATVMYTHQFKGALLNQRQSDVIHLNDGQFEISSFDAVVNSKDFCFGKLYKCLDRFVLTFNQDGLYVFEPSCSSLAFWCKDQNIRDVKVVNNLLYIWSKDLEVNVLSLNTIEDLILKTLMRKQYRLCGQLCVRFSKEIEEMIATSRKIHLITILASKLNVDEHSDLLEKLSSLIERIKGEAKQKLPLGKVKNGITMVNNIHSLNGTEPAEPSIDDEEKTKSPLDIIREQYKVHKTHRNVNTKDFTKLLESVNLDEVYDLLHEFSSDELSSIWCKEIFLGLLHETGNYNVLSEENKLNFATEAFLTVNGTSDGTCTICDFPLPAAHLVKPQYYTTGCKLLEKLGEHESLTKNIPYMHKFSLNKLSEPVEIKEKLSLVIQYSDEEVVVNLSKFFTYDLWDDSLRLVAALKHGYCLNCGREIDSKGSIGWQSFAKIIVQSINAMNTMKLLERYADLIPDGDLNESFYQYCIFSSVSNLSTKQLNMVDKMVGSDMDLEKQFDRSVARFLNKKYLNSELYTLVPKKPLTTILTCDHCNLPLNTPILDELSRLQCGHIYHKICFLHKGNTCWICNNK